MTPEAELLLLHLKLLLLLGVANGAPILGHRILRQRFAQPLDGGARFLDGRPVFGPSKTLRGVALALGATPLAALVIGLDPYLGFVVGLYAMLGDLTSSFVKRRLGMPSSSQALGLDQIPESLFPLLAVRTTLGLAASEIVLLVAVFLILELAVSRVLFKLRLRDQPY
ncbi:MAG TPA: CDP-archaeol synthase [Burkholderiales bacterium]